MNQAIYFKTSMFDVAKEKENPINPVYGISLLEWLRDELREQLDITEPDAEDWGWYSELEYQGNRYLIGACAQFEAGDDPAEELDWVFQVEKFRSFKEKLLGKNKMTDSDGCFLFFKRLFENHPSIKEVQVG
ncbi:hypothetical protein [Oceanisphaera arctica]|uniref:Uncharacterized protein n=1 Tax=Oceanisphaera arctica TaxID=641510 RepID=A0A2P5TJ46_9GAMM|nr:hypothetical protein [Oceanisphaera arctica]PPL14934.1 hypothetical protein UN63_14265 [Oceanisphaera arctica]GHA22742.1 hypothetical protein GCM10007082_24330 [Oceanisphaera arctica]